MCPNVKTTEQEKIMKYSTALALVLTILMATTVSADVDVENENADRFTLSAYARVRYSQFGGALTIPDRSFSIESAGLTADFDIDDNLNGQLQLEIKPDEIFLKDCYILWEPYRMIELQAGQFKKPFCLNTITSTWNLQAIDHSITHRELSDLLYSGRDIGVTGVLNADPVWIPRLSLGVFNGSPDALNQDNEIQYVGRAEFDLPLGIMIGADLSTLRFGKEDPESVDGYTCSARQKAMGADLQLNIEINRDFSFLLRSEYLRGDNWQMVDVIEGVDPPEFQTWWVTGGITWKTDKPAVDNISASVSMASWQPDRSVDSREDELTLTFDIDTGTPLSIRAAVVNHRPHNIIFEENHTDYILELALDI